jgi:hypothetical protein
MTRTNRYASQCADCGTDIPANAGQLTKAADGWIVRCADSQECTARTATAAAQATAQADSRAAQLAADPGVSSRWTAAEEAALAAASIDSPFDPGIADALEAAGFVEAAALERAQDAAVQSPARSGAAARPRTTRRTSPRQGSPARRGTLTASRRRACVTGGNCSSTTGRDCGGYNCDAN